MPKTNAPKEKSNAFHVVRGKAMYAKLFEPALPAPAYADTIPVMWAVDVLVDSATKSRLQAAGMSFGKPNPKYEQFVAEKGLREQGYDGSYIRAKKPTTKKQYDAEKGEVVKDKSGQPVLVEAPRPMVTDSSGAEIPMEAFEKGFAIGNGSDVEVTYTITKPSIGGFGRYGARLVRTKILDLVKYERPDAGSFVFHDDVDAVF